MALAICTSAAPVRAQAPGHELTVETLEHGSWPATVAALQRDTDSEGRTVHVLVSESDGSRVPCGSYELDFDEADAAALHVGDCDPSTNATAVQLLSRSALFEHGGTVPVPRRIELSATEIRVASSVGGAPLTGCIAVGLDIADASATLHLD